jgi:hypothetical protein
MCVYIYVQCDTYCDIYRYTQQTPHEEEETLQTVLRPTCVCTLLQIVFYISLHTTELQQSQSYTTACILLLIQQHVSSSSYTTPCILLLIYNTMYPPPHIQHHVSSSSYTTACVLLLIYNTMYPPPHIQQHVSSSSCTTACILLLIYNSMYPPPDLQQHVSSSSYTTATVSVPRPRRPRTTQECFLSTGAS